MILIADSGSTKTDWRLIDDRQQIHQCSTQGINPYFHNSTQIAKIIGEELFLQPRMNIGSEGLEVFFYGAGCRVEDKQQVVKQGLAIHFPSAEIHIYTDLFGAARAMCGHTAGIVAILGTGANTCYYDGENIIQNRTSGGFIFGDEGSGAHIGKTFVQDFLNDDVPPALAARFSERFKLNKDLIIDAVYRQPMPNRFLASFSKFIYQNLKEQYVIDLVSGCFKQFFEKQVCRYEKHKEVKLNCVGSVAFYYSNILRSVAESYGVSIDKIVENPIAGLTLYHLGEE